MSLRSAKQSCQVAGRLHPPPAEGPKLSIEAGYDPVRNR